MSDRGVLHRLVGPGDNPPGVEWRAGRLSVRSRLLVLLAGEHDECELLRRAWEGQAVDVRYDADLALALVHAGLWNPDMVVVGHPAGPIGPLDFVRTLRRAGASIPVVVGLTEAGPSEPEIRAAGATAVVRPPFAAEAILGLLSASLPDDSFRIKPLPIDLGRLRVDGAATRMWVDGAECLLPAMEHRLLRYLAERHGQIVSRDELVGAAWGERESVLSNSLAVHLARVRRRLQAHSGVDWIRSVRGCGYQLVVPRRLSTRRSAAGG